MSKFHDGERRVQERAREVEDAESNGSVIANTIMPGAKPFIARQVMLAAASVAANGSPWASLLFGPAGFVTAQAQSLTGQTHQLVSDTLGGVIEPEIAFIWVIIGVSPHAFYADFLFV